MTNQISESKLNNTGLRHSADTAMVVVLWGLDFGTPETPALREVDL